MSFGPPGPVPGSMGAEVHVVTQLVSGDKSPIDAVVTCDHAGIAQDIPSANTVASAIRRKGRPRECFVIVNNGGVFISLSHEALVTTHARAIARESIRSLHCHEQPSDGVWRRESISCRTRLIYADQTRPNQPDHAQTLDVRCLQHARIGGALRRIMTTDGSIHF